MQHNVEHDGFKCLECERIRTRTNLAQHTESHQEIPA